MKNRMIGLGVGVLLIVLFFSCGVIYADLEAGQKAYDQHDYVTALNEFRDAAEKGDANAQYAVALMTWQGQGRPYDIPEAVRWYQEAATRGHVLAHLTLGNLYEKGWGIERSYHLARLHYQNAAAQGNLAAKQYLPKLAWNYLVFNFFENPLRTLLLHEQKEWAWQGAIHSPGPLGYGYGIGMMLSGGGVSAIFGVIFLLVVLSMSGGLVAGVIIFVKNLVALFRERSTSFDVRRVFSKKSFIGLAIFLCFVALCVPWARHNLQLERACSLTTPADELAQMVQFPQTWNDLDLIANISCNPSAPPETLHAIADHFQKERVAFWALSNRNRIRDCLSRNPHTPPDILNLIAQDSSIKR